VAMSGMVSSAIRLGAIGAVAAQGVVARLIPRLAELADSPLGERIESFAPRLDVAAIRHSRGESRLFAN
jgi:urease accessory protein